MDLKSPENEIVFDPKDQKLFDWSAPDNGNPGQQYKYYFKIIELNEGDDPQQAVEFGSPWYDYTSIITPSPGWNHTVTQEIEPLKKYAWQVIAFSGEQEVAKSSVRTFSGPPLIEKFLAGNNEIQVVETDNADSLAANGWARL